MKTLNDGPIELKAFAEVVDSVNTISKTMGEIFQKTLKVLERFNGDCIYVTIGVPFSKIPMVTKASIFVDRENHQTEIQAAKLYRKNIAEHLSDHGWIPGIKFTPAELYYEIYNDANDDLPWVCSANAPALKTMKQRANEGRVSIAMIQDHFSANTIED